MQRAKDKVTPSVIPASAINAADIKCPRCKGSHLILDGYLQRLYSVETDKGIVVNNSTTEESWMHDIKVIRCQSMKCLSVYSIISDDMWNLMQATQPNTKPV